LSFDVRLVDILAAELDLGVRRADLAPSDMIAEIVARGGTISVRVLNELANVTRRKMLPFSWDETNDRRLAALSRGANSNRCTLSTTHER
jgi:hypothetical protein